MVLLDSQDRVDTTTAPQYPRAKYHSGPKKKATQFQVRNAGRHVPKIQGLAGLRILAGVGHDASGVRSGSKSQLGLPA